VGNNKIRQIISIFLSSVLLSVTFQNLNLEFLAYIALVPLFFALEKCTKKEATSLSFICGLIFFGITIFWVHHVSIPGYILLILILSIFFGIFGLFFITAKRHMLYAIFIIPALWVILEYVRSNIFTGFGWSLLAHSQYVNLPIIQISDITGAYGVSFLVMMANVTIYYMLSSGIKKALPALLIALFIFSGALGYGHFRLNHKEAAKEVLNISLIQGNIPQSLKWDPQFKDHIFNVYSRLTKEASIDNPNLIVWPETSFPDFIEEKAFSHRLEGLSKDVKTYLLVGAPSYGDPENEAIFNSAILLSGGGKIVGQYNKLHLVPFGEYIPLGGLMEFLRGVIDKPIGDFTKGDEYTIFELKNGPRFAVLICFEDIFSNLVRNFATRDVDFMINITNDAWFMKSSAPYQHAQSSVFRAVENRVPVVRAANTGLSCFIDKFGRITDTVKVNGEEIFVAGHKTRKIIISSKKSFYTRFGDLFILLCVMPFIINEARRWLKRYP